MINITLPSERALNVSDVLVNFWTDKYSKREKLKVLSYLEINDRVSLDKAAQMYFPDYYNDSAPEGDRFMSISFTIYIKFRL